MTCYLKAASIANTLVYFVDHTALKRFNDISPIPCTWTGAILTSLCPVCQVKIISREFITTPHTITYSMVIATPQIIVLQYTLYVVTTHWYSNLPGNNVDFPTGP